MTLQSHNIQVELDVTRITFCPYCGTLLDMDYKRETRTVYKVCKSDCGFHADIDRFKCECGDTNVEG